MTFEDYMKNSKNDLKRVLDDVANAGQTKGNGDGFEKDPDEWYPAVDKSKSGYAIIRFLPGPKAGKKDFVNYFTHEFKNDDTDEWYIENCLTTIDQVDPVGEFNKILWNVGGKDDLKTPEKAQARLQKRKLNYRANVFVLADPINPENNGKIKKFKFGKSIFDFITGALSPQELPGIETPEPFNPFNLFEGANFKIVIYTKDDYRKYDKSHFMPNTAQLFDDKKKLEAIYNEINNDPKWSLVQYTDPSKFKSYEVLKKRLDKVLGYDFKERGQPQSVPTPKPTNVPRTPKTPVEDTPPWNEEPKSVTAVDKDFFASLAEDEV